MHITNIMPTLMSLAALLFSGYSLYESALRAPQLLGRLEPYLARLSTVVVIALAEGDERRDVERGITGRGIACTTLLVDEDLTRKIRERKELAWSGSPGGKVG